MVLTSVKLVRTGSWTRSEGCMVNTSESFIVRYLARNACITLLQKRTAFRSGRPGGTAGTARSMSAGPAGAYITQDDGAGS